tara:strand:+ start:174 stop:1073 length:900 start_codon:yes stop_codon:yes gene_type:complete
MEKVVGYLGLGNMGHPMAMRIADAGHKLLVFDINKEVLIDFRERQISIAESIRDLADKADIIICSLPSNEIIREAVIGSEGLVTGNRVKTYINACTTGSNFASEISDELLKNGIATLEAPISGGPPGARDGTLSIMASGPLTVYKEVKPVLESYGKKLVFCGEKPGLAQVLKLANNILFATSIFATTEAIAMGVKAGLDPSLMLDAIQSGTGRNATVDLVMPNSVLSRSFDFGATIGILMKDVNLALEEGEKQGVPQPVSQQVRQMMLLAMHQGWEQRDLSELVKLVENWSDTEIKLKL